MEDGDDEDGVKPIKKRKTGEDKPEIPRLLACPFFKNNPVRYKGCNKYVLKEVHRLK